MSQNGQVKKILPFRAMPKQCEFSTRQGMNTHITAQTHANTLDIHKHRSYTPTQLPKHNLDISRQQKTPTHANRHQETSKCNFQPTSNNTWESLKMSGSVCWCLFVHNVLIQGSVVVIRQFLIFINQTFLMVSVALVTMVDWRVHLFSCLGPLLGPLGGPEGALEAPKMPKITISCFDYRNAPKWVEQGPKIGWTLQNTFRGVC